jgi:hypothetical protein
MKWKINKTNEWEEAQKLANEGWELVNVCEVVWETFDKYGEHNSVESETTYYFKKLNKK